MFTIGCCGIPAVLDNYLGKALEIWLGWHATDLQWPTICVHCRVGPIVQAEDPPLSCWTLIITIHVQGYGCRPPRFIDLLLSPITTAFHHLLDQATYPPSTSLLSRWVLPSIQSACLLLQTLQKPLVRQIISQMRNNHLCWLQIVWQGWSLGDWAAKQLTVVRFQLKVSKWLTQILLGILAAILIISLVVVVLAVVVR